MFAIASSVLLLMAQAASTTSKPRPAIVLQVGIFSYGPDGQPQAAAYTTDASQSYQYVAGCEIGSGNRPVPDRATDAWRVSTIVERMNEEEAVVRLDWQRVRAGGTPATSPGASVQLTLHPGDRVPLDSATPNPTAGCGGRTIAFEARFTTRPEWMVVPGRGPLTESPAVTIMRGGGSGRGAGWGSGTGAPAGVGSAVRLPKTNTNESMEFSADLWLVKSDARQEKPEFNSQGLVLEKVRGTTAFAFSPFTIDTPAGPITVQIAGSMQVTTERGAAELIFSTTRTVRLVAGGPSRDTTSNTSGTSTTRNPMPAPGDVLSFELPPIRVPNSTATVPDQYSVRVRIR